METAFEKISYTRGYGFCPDCSEHFAPVDLRLGLHERASASPRLQEIAALSVLRSPANQAAEDVLCVTGIPMSASTLPVVRANGRCGHSTATGDEATYSREKTPTELTYAPHQVSQKTFLCRQYPYKKYIFPTHISRIVRRKSFREKST
jgi:hypothetical protein